jgi:predicted DNA-binding protein (MmcQ/YjbR family)
MARNTAKKKTAPARARGSSSSRAPKRSTVALLRKIALALPDAVETITWGEPHFRVGGKIFGGVGRSDGREVTSAKLEKPHAEALLLDPRFSPAPYVGKHGWVQFALEAVTPAELERLVHESYRLVAPKRVRGR